MTKEPTEFERQKIIVERLYAKIDYLKNARLRIPVFVAAANFALTTLSTRADETESTAILFVVGFALTGLVGILAMLVVRSSFRANVVQLANYYRKMEIDPDMAEPASRIWWLLLSLVVLTSALPSALVLTVDFTPFILSKP